MTEPRDAQGRQDALNFAYDLDAPPAKVWRAVTVPDFVERWLLARPVAEEAGMPDRPGTPPGPAALASLRVLDQVPGRWIRYSWQEAGHGLPDSVVTFRLDANAAGGTTLSIIHVLASPVRMPAAETAANSNTPMLMLRAA